MKQRKETVLFMVMCLLGSGAFAQIPTNGLVSYWPFSGNAIDSVGQVNNGTVTGATLVADRFGNSNSAYFFDGNGDYIDVGNDASLRSGSHSLSFWFKYTDTSSTMHMISNFNSIGGEYGSAAVHNATVGLQYNVGSGTGAKNMLHQSHTRYADDQWHLYTSVYDESRKMLALYIDDKLLGGVNYVTDSGFFKAKDFLTYKNGEHWYFGASSQFFSSTQNFGPLYFKGSLDDVRYYNRALLPREILEIYHEGELCADYTDTLKIDVQWGSNKFNYVRATVYPNPTKDKVTIDFGDYTKIAGYKVRINNTLGQQLFEGTISARLMEINLSTMGADGTYTLNILNNSGSVVSTKIILLY